MSTRLQVVMDDEELAHLRRLAEREGMSLAEWVRVSLRKAARARPAGRASAKLAAVSAALEHSFPAPDIDQMLDEIAAGHAQELETSR